MPEMSGFEVLERVAELPPRFGATPFLFLTAMTDRDNELRGRRLGADDFVKKPIDFDILGEIIGARLGRAERRGVWAEHATLTEREIETLTWSARGKTSHEIGLILNLSKRTVDFHIDGAIRKLGVATRIEAAVKAATARLIKL